MRKIDYERLEREHALPAGGNFLFLQKVTKNRPRGSGLLDLHGEGIPVNALSGRLTTGSFRAQYNQWQEVHYSARDRGSPGFYPWGSISLLKFQPPLKITSEIEDSSGHVRYYFYNLYAVIKFLHIPSK
jgi:hypothetical protein